MRAVVLGVAILLVSVTAKAQYRVVVGQGTSSCSEWTQESPRRTARANSMANWAIGFVAGANVFQEDDRKDFLSELTTPQALSGWIDKYCKENPLDVLGTAASKLVLELRARREKSP